MEGACQFISLFLDRRTIVSGTSFLFSCTAFSLLTSQLDLLQLLLLPLLLQAPQRTQHERRLALDGRPDQGDEDLKINKNAKAGHYQTRKCTAAFEHTRLLMQSHNYLIVSVTSRVLSVVMSPVM